MLRYLVLDRLASFAGTFPCFSSSLADDRGETEGRVALFSNIIMFTIDPLLDGFSLEMTDILRSKLGNVN